MSQEQGIQKAAMKMWSVRRSPPLTMKFMRWKIFWVVQPYSGTLSSILTNWICSAVFQNQESTTVQNNNNNEGLGSVYQGDGGDESISCGEEVENSVLPRCGAVDFVPPPQIGCSLTLHGKRRALSAATCNHFPLLNINQYCWNLKAEREREREGLMVHARLCSTRQSTTLHKHKYNSVCVCVCGPSFTVRNRVRDPHTHFRAPSPLNSQLSFFNLPLESHLHIQNVVPAPAYIGLCLR